MKYYNIKYISWWYYYSLIPCCCREKAVPSTVPSKNKTALLSHFWCTLWCPFSAFWWYHYLVRFSFSELNKIWWYRDVPPTLPTDTAHISPFAVPSTTFFDGTANCLLSQRIPPIKKKNKKNAKIWWYRKNGINW